jgi:hypothetical protein
MVRPSQGFWRTIFTTCDRVYETFLSISFFPMSWSATCKDPISETCFLLGLIELLDIA